MISKDLYNNSTVLNFQDGETLMERNNYVHKESDGDKLHLVIDGETLTALSFKYYGEPLYWYLIADINNIINPFESLVGKTILIPNINLYK